MILEKPLYQWDVGKQIAGLECTHVDICNRGDSRAGRYEVVDGAVTIPAQYLQTGNELIVFCVNVDNETDTDVTLSVTVFPVKNRAKPKDYTPDEAKEAISIVRELTEDAAEAAEEAKQYAEEAASAKNRALIVTYSLEYELADHSVADIWRAAKDGRDVFLKMPGEDVYLPLVFVDKSANAQFCRYSENSVTVYEVWDDASVNEVILAMGDKIDDSKIGNDAWSSKNIIDRLCPSFEKSGTLVQCETVAGYPLSVQAKEDGEKEGVTVTVCGKNLYNPSKEGGYPLTDGYWINKGNGAISGEGKHAEYCATQKAIPVSHLRGQYITLNYRPGGNAPGMAFYDQTDVYLGSLDGGDGGKGLNVKVPEDAWLMRFTSLMANKNEVQIEIGSQSTYYEPYSDEKFEASGDAAGEFITVNGIVGRAGVTTVYAKNGRGEVTDVKVSGKADPVSIIEKLTNAVISLGGNV